MEDNVYDIFISYRRGDTTDKAEHLCTLLEHKYEGKVSFDKENLQGTFDIELAKRIDTCTDFILVVGKNSLKYKKDSLYDEIDLYNFLAKASIEEFASKLLELGVNKKLDFFRIEIARALQRKGSGINIIVVAPYSDVDFNFSELELPPDIEQVVREEAVFYHIHKDAYFKEIKNKLYNKLKTKSGISDSKKKIQYKIRVNRPSVLYIDDEEILQLEANKINKILLLGGEYWRKVVAIDDENVYDEKEIILSEFSKLDDIHLNANTIKIWFTKYVGVIKKNVGVIKKRLLCTLCILLFAVVLWRIYIVYENKMEEKKIAHDIAVDNFMKALENSSESTICMFDTAYYWLNQVKEIDFDNDMYIGYCKNLNDKLQRVDSVMRNRYDKLPASASQTRLNMKNKLDSIQEIINKL